MKVAFKVSVALVTYLPFIIVLSTRMLNMFLLLI